MTLAPRYCDALCADMVTQFLFLLSARSGLVFRQLRETVRASCKNQPRICTDYADKTAV